jgi:hypothetical protein
MKLANLEKMLFCISIQLNVVSFVRVLICWKQVASPVEPPKLKGLQVIKVIEEDEYW